MILMKPSLELVPVFLALWHVGAIPLVVDPGASKEQKLKSIEDIRAEVLVGIPLVHAASDSAPQSFSLHPPARSPSAVFRRSAGPRSSLFCACPTDGPFAKVRLRGQTIRWLSYSLREARALPRAWFIRTRMARPLFKSCSSRSASGPAEMPGLPSRVCHLFCRFRRHCNYAGHGSALSPGCRSGLPVRYHSRAKTQRRVHADSGGGNLSKYCAERGEKIPYLRKILTTGASVPIELVERVQRVMAEPEGDLHVMYGATEALCISYATGRELLARSPQNRDGQGTYLGRPAPGITVKIIAISNGPIERWSSDLVLAPRQIGEICVFGPVVTPAYHGKPEATRKAKIPDVDGLWHRMGDAGYLDEDGGIWYCGRIADRLETAAGHFYSDLVEPIFNRHPQVNRSALVGVPVPGSSLQRSGGADRTRARWPGSRSRRSSKS